MVSMRKRQAPTRSTVVAYTLKTMLLLFGVLFALSFAYRLFLSLTTNKLYVVQLIMPSIVIIVCFVLGLLVDKKHPGHTIALFFFIMAYSLAAGTIAEGLSYFSELLSIPYANTLNSIALVLVHILWMPGVYIILFFIPLYFPTGKLLSPRWGALVVLFLGVQIWTVITVILRPWPWPAFGIGDTRSMNGIPGSEPFFDAIWNVGSTLSIVATLFVPIAMYLRYKRSEGVERVQMRWPIAAILLFIFIGAIVWLQPTLATFDENLGYPITWSLVMLFPVSIGIGILRYRLFEIDIIINRTLVYGSLTTLVIAMYVVIVGGLGALLQVQTNTLVGLAAAGIVAVLFQPLRDGLQRRVNRLLYGERDDPAVVLSRLAHHHETADAPTDILPNLVQTIANTLKIPHVSIWLPTGVDQMEPVAAWGDPLDYAEVIPLTYQKGAIGHLVVAPRGPQEQFNRYESDLLATIAALTATTVRAVKLSDELRRSRQRIVTAREDERRRLRRDLHDGLGPQLASQMLGLEAVAQLIPTNPHKAQGLLDSLKNQAEEAILDVRRLVYDLRPPALDDLGLIEALEQSASRYEKADLRFKFDVPDALPELPAAVETAVYRIAQEAMTNVVHHAEATLCIVRLFRQDAYILLEVRDNGRGLPPNHRSGVGLQAMQERTTELNGECVLESLPGGGTLVRARLPLEV